MSERVIRSRVQLIQVADELAEQPASTPMTQEEQEALATVAALNGVSLSNASVSNYIRSFNNTGYAEALQAATKN